MEQKKVLLVDGMALLFRGYFATAVHGNYMYNKEGIPTNGVHGFTKHMLKAVESFTPTHVICCWDLGSRTFRTELFPAYKGNRSAPEEQMVPQFAMAREITDGFGIPSIDAVNYEADDCLGTLACAYAEEADVYILTGDQDMLQLANQKIQIAIMKKGQGNYQLYNEAAVKELKGCHPDQLVDIKALMGDTSDNYPGVKGIGEKTALKLIQEYQTIEGVLDNLALLPAGQRRKIEAELEMLHLSRKLAAIRCDAPVSLPLEKAVWQADEKTAGDTLTRLGLNISIEQLMMGSR